MGEYSTQQLMEEQISKSWQRNKLTVEIYLYIFKKRGMGGTAEAHHFYSSPHPHRLSAVKILVEKRGALW